MNGGRSFDRALALYRAGNAGAALDILERSGDLGISPDALNVAAVAATALGQRDKAVHYWRALIATRPEHLGARTNLGLLLLEARRYDDAEAFFQSILKYAPDHADTYVNLGNLHRAADRLDQAEAAYRRALALQAGHVNAQYNLGLLLAAQERLAEAEGVFLDCLAAQPGQADVYNELGNIYQDRSRLAEAEAAYRQAIRLSPDYADAQLNLARLLLREGRQREASQLLSRVLAIRPDHPDALKLLANLHAGEGQAAEAEEVFRRLLALRPDAATIHNDFGLFLKTQGRFAEAERCSRSALQLGHDFGGALGNAVGCARRLFDWTHAAEDGQAVLDFLSRDVRGIPPLVTMFLPEAASPEWHLKAARLAVDVSQGSRSGFPGGFADSGPGESDRLKIGYLSADYREHAVTHVMARVLERHDRERFEIIAYSTGMAVQDAMRRRVEATCDVFRDLQAVSDAVAAERIVADGIDILVDLTGHTYGSRPGITAARPAPVLVNWLGFPGSLGHARLADYIIGDRTVTPASAAAHFSECIAQMPHCYLPYDGERTLAPPPARVEQGLPQHAFVFGAFNQAVKLNPETFDLWCQLLQAVPDSVLWLARAGRTAQANLRREAEQRGVSGARLIFAERTATVASHLARLPLIDLALDSYPYNSHSTGADLLWAGVPMVTRMGETFAGRVGASLLRTVGLAGLIASNWNGYLEVATGLARDRDALRAVRRQLAEQREASPLFDSRGFARDLEALYRRIWAHRAEGRSGPLLADGEDPILPAPGNEGAA